MEGKGWVREGVHDSELSSWSPAVNPFPSSLSGSQALVSKCGPPYSLFPLSPDVSAGIADYRPKDGETIELRLVSW